MFCGIFMIVRRGFVENKQSLANFVGKNLIILFLGVLVIVVFVIFALGRMPKPDNSSGKIHVTASFYPLYFFASEIGGDKAVVNNITPAGAEPHDYEPTPQDIAKIENSKLLILNGGFEAWGDKIKGGLVGKGVVLVIAGEGLLTKSDPHVWLSPALAKIETQRILAGFIKVDPTNTSYYSKNEKELETKLIQLDQDYKKGLKDCVRRDIVTSHSAFGYLADAYGFNQIAISGLSPDSEPSSQTLVEIVNFVRKNDIKYIFFEKLVSPKLSDTIASETGAKLLVLDPLEGIPQDEIEKGADYFSVMRANLSNLEVALECQK